MPDNGDRQAATPTGESEGRNSPTAEGSEAQASAASEGDCETYGGQLAAYFYTQCDEDRLTADARAHLERTAAWVICYALDVGHKDNPAWWTEFGKAYWIGHVDTLTRHFLPKAPAVIDGRCLQGAINRMAKGFETHLRARFYALRAREFERVAAGGQGESETHSDGLTPAKIVEILECCPFKEKSL